MNDNLEILSIGTIGDIFIKKKKKNFYIPAECKDFPENICVYTKHRKIVKLNTPSMFFFKFEDRFKVPT